MAAVLPSLKVALPMYNSRGEETGSSSGDAYDDALRHL